MISGRDGHYHPDDALAGLTPSRLEKAFGPGVDVDLPSKGYTDPEWYWQSSDGCVWGIGWRWNRPRIRGKGDLNAEKAKHFVDFLFSSLESPGMTEHSLKSFTEDLESIVVQLVFDRTLGTAFDMSNCATRSAVVKALAKAAETFDRTDEEWQEMME